MYTPHFLSLTDTATLREMAYLHRVPGAAGMLRIELIENLLKIR